MSYADEKGWPTGPPAGTSSRCRRNRAHISPGSATRLTPTGRGRSRCSSVTSISTYKSSATTATRCGTQQRSPSSWPSSGARWHADVRVRVADTLAAMPSLADHAVTQPDKVAVIEIADDRERTRSYGELGARVNQLARVFHRLGAAPGSRIAVMLANSLEFVEAGMATGAAQCWYVPVNWHLKTDELAYLLQDSGAKVLVTSPALEGIARAAT